MAAMVTGVEYQSLCITIDDPGGDASTPDRQVCSTFQAFDRDQIGFIGKAQGLPSSAFGWGMNETTDE